MSNHSESFLNSMVSTVDFFVERDGYGVFKAKSSDYLSIKAEGKSLDQAVEQLQEKIKNYLRQNYL